MSDRTLTVGAGKTYASLSAAVTAQRSYLDLTTDNGTGGAGKVTIECYNLTAGAEDTTALSMGSGWTTTADYYIEIKGAESEKTSSNTGKWSADRYRLHVTNNGNVTSLDVGPAFTRLTDLQLKRTGVSLTTNYQKIVNITVASVRVERCIFVAAVTGTSANILRGLNSGTGASTVVVNCLAYDFYNAEDTDEVLAGFYNESGTITLYNCTTHNCFYGFQRASGTGTNYNCGAAATPAGGTAFQGTWTSYNNSSTTPTFVNEAGDDFHLDAGDTTWKDAGDGATPKGVFTDDVDGDARPAADGDWDIGFDEYVVGAGAAGSLNPTVTL